MQESSARVEEWNHNLPEIYYICLVAETPGTTTAGVKTGNLESLSIKSTTATTACERDRSWDSRLGIQRLWKVYFELLVVLYVPDTTEPLGGYVRTSCRILEFWFACWKSYEAQG